VGVTTVCIEWPEAITVVSEKDQTWSAFIINISIIMEVVVSDASDK
jgi:hypothetical protein